MSKRKAVREVFSSPRFKIQEVDLIFDNGEERTFRYFDKADTAMIVPLTDDCRVLFVREYAVALDEYQLGLPKGAVEEGSDALTTANKELQEEIGYRAEKLTKLGVLTMSPGYISQKTHVFLAEGLVPSKLEGDEVEELEMRSQPFSAFEELIDSGELNEARMISALYMARRHMQNAQ